MSTVCDVRWSAWRRLVGGPVFLDAAVIPTSCNPADFFVHEVTSSAEHSQIRASSAGRTTYVQSQLWLSCSGLVSSARPLRMASRNRLGAAVKKTSEDSLRRQFAEDMYTSCNPARRSELEVSHRRALERMAKCRGVLHRCAESNFSCAVLPTPNGSPLPHQAVCSNQS